MPLSVIKIVSFVMKFQHKSETVTTISLLIINYHSWKACSTADNSLFDLTYSVAILL
jgi:hypothetical protein